MPIPGLHALGLNDSVLVEPQAGENRLVVWVPRERGQGFQQWDRIGTVASGAIACVDGICGMPATLVRVQQRFRGFLGKLVSRFTKATGESSWVLPGGETADQCGQRRNDLMLAWSEYENTPLDEARIKARWPQSQRIDKLGANLFLVIDVEAPNPETPQAVLDPDLRKAAEELLAAARKAGNRAQEISALTDLGLLFTRSCEAKRALAVLEEAVALARQTEDRAREDDAQYHLALAALAAGQRVRARELLEKRLDIARENGDRFAEKKTLEGLGHFFANVRAPQEAIRVYEQAQAIACQVGDRQHEADLLWYMGIQYAEMDQRDLAIAKAEAAIEVLRSVANPQAGWLTGHLQKFRNASRGAPLAANDANGNDKSSEPQFGDSIIAANWAPQASSSAKANDRGPGLLRMAISSVKSMAHFLGSGLKTVAAPIHDKRLRTCVSCEHHTGLRCRLCGCFTNAKAWLPHEKCPIGKWPG
jgi:tetratricopeptide (TPR) repeat protein